MTGGSHDDLLAEAIVADGDGYRALYADRIADAHASLRVGRGALPRAPGRRRRRAASGAWWPTLKSATLAGEPEDAAAYVRAALGGACDSPTSCYALAIAALIEDDDATAARAAVAMTEGDAAFLRAAEALAALAARDRDGYARAVAAIIADFEGREQHLTGVAVADTALLMEALAERRDMAVRPVSELLPDGV